MPDIKHLLSNNNQFYSPLMLATILAAIKIGAIYLPIDTITPTERIAHILQDCSCKFILTSHTLASQVSFSNTLIFADEIIFDYTKKITVEKYSGNEQDLVYIIYTSGSSGKPKGVMIENRSLVNLIYGLEDLVGLGGLSKIACLTSISFDIFFVETIMALCLGLTIVLASDKEQQNPKYLSTLISENSIDAVQMTPSRLHLLHNYDPDLRFLSSVKKILVGGEVFPQKMLKILQSKSNAQIYNLYGPTEATVWATVSDLTNKEDVDIGVPIKNMRLYIMDQDQAILPNGTIGEICIAGLGLSKGYVNNELLTQDRFVYDEKNLERIYRTGDIGKRLNNGSYQYIGRRDNQVKIRGYRVELEEIEYYLNLYPTIEQAVVKVVLSHSGSAKLQAYYTSSCKTTHEKIREYLKAYIPEYMIPSEWFHVDLFYYNLNGKIDRYRLDELPRATTESELTCSIGGRSTIRKKVLDIIAQYIHTPLTDITKKPLSEVGVDSIGYISIIVALEEEFHIEFDDEFLMLSATPDIDCIVSYIESFINFN